MPIVWTCKLALLADYGRDLARSYGATLHVIHVVEELIAFHGADIGVAIADVAPNVEDAAPEDLNEAIARDRRIHAETIEFPLADAPAVYDKLKAGEITGRAVPIPA